MHIYKPIKLLLTFYVEYTKDHYKYQHIQFDLNETRIEFGGLNLLRYCVLNRLLRLVPIFLSLQINRDKILLTAINNGDLMTVNTILDDETWKNSKTRIDVRTEMAMAISLGWVCDLFLISFSLSLSPYIFIDLLTEYL